MSPPSPPLPPPPASPLRSVGAGLALLAAGAQVVAGFHHWAPDGRVALDVALVSSEPKPLLSFGSALLLLAAIPALAALVTPRGWPRLASAVATAALVLWWVALGPVGPPATGVQLAAAAVCGHLVAAALAPDRRRWPPPLSALPR